ncbi:MAG: hypothetical protein A2539_06515 [Elusimicrobia bacterium RIFOXYD2_FULL_34_15]|nr:MAG: hypothetical protein A2539_06515 [Elusimicrobia bacterium RIFOXYD2_FULL_34_15]
MNKIMKTSLIIIFFINVCCFVFSADKNEPTTITGDKMKILSKGDIMEFLGNVKFKQKNLEIIADEMKSNDKNGEITGKGNINIHYSSGMTNINGWADEAQYSKNSGSGIFFGNVKMKRFLTNNTTDVVNMTCEKLEISDFGEKFHAIKDVKIFQEGTEMLSDEAFYDKKTDELLLLGGPPKIIRRDEKNYSEYTGDKIILALEKEILTILGNVQSKMIMK